MTALGLLLALTLPAADADAKKTPPAAKVSVTAELACLHCTYGEGDGCAVCLKINEVTPLLLAGKVANQLSEDRLSKRVVVIDGVLTLNKDKRLVLTSDSFKALAGADAEKAVKGQAVVVGPAICASCDLKVADTCSLAVLNAGFPVLLDGKLAAQHAEGGTETLTAAGRLFVDKKGAVRLEATKATLSKKQE